MVISTRTAALRGRGLKLPHSTFSRIAGNTVFSEFPQIYLAYSKTMYFFINMPLKLNMGAVKPEGLFSLIMSCVLIVWVLRAALQANQSTDNKTVIGPTENIGWPAKENVLYLTNARCSGIKDRMSVSFRVVSRLSIFRWYSVSY